LNAPDPAGLKGKRESRHPGAFDSIKCAVEKAFVTLPCRRLMLCVLGVCVAAAACSFHRRRAGFSTPEPPEEDESPFLNSIPFDTPEEQLLREFKRYYSQFRDFTDKDIPISEEATIDQDYRDCAIAFNSWLSYVVGTVRERGELVSPKRGSEPDAANEYSERAHAVSDALDKFDHDLRTILHIPENGQVSDRRNKPYNLGYRIIDRFRGCNSSAAQVVGNELSAYSWDGAPFLD